MSSLSKRQKVFLGLGLYVGLIVAMAAIASIATIRAM